MRTRRKARESALQALYQFDSTGDWSADSYQLFLSVYCQDDVMSVSHKQNLKFFEDICLGVIQQLSTLDRAISAASTHWNLERMSRVDRNILRISAYEVIFLVDVPVNASINEAIEIAKRFGADDSPTFINGVLDKLARLVESSPEVFQISSESLRKRAVNE